jgi:DNA-binding NtrC family response regulator
MTESGPIRILVVDDDVEHREATAGMVATIGYVPETAQHGEEALEKLGSESFNAILADLFPPRLDGSQLLRALLERCGRTPAIVLSGFGDVSHTVSIVHDLGAYWFLQRPVQIQVLHAVLERAVRHERLTRECAMLQRQAGYRGPLVDLVGESRVMQQVFALIQSAAPSAATVLISGESGTGKELAARAIHKLSPRAAAPFVAINCAALPADLIESELFGYEQGAFTDAMARRIGCFEQAHRGTLFLDEITEMEIGTQAKLLRVLQNGRIRRLGGASETPIDVRIVAATNRPPEGAVQEGRLREDLYYRLNVFQIAMPALRHRKEDLSSLVESLIRDLNARHNCKVDGVEPEVLARLMCHSWPGNARELRNVLERVVIVAREGTLGLDQFPPTLGVPKMDLSALQARQKQGFKFREGATLDEVERAYIDFTLSQIGNNKRRAAKILGISERTMYNREAEYGTVYPPSPVKFGF